MKKVLNTYNAGETKAVAVELAGQLQGREVILLVGELGAGKTTFVQALAAKLGVRDLVKSPTFTIANEHPVHHPKIKTLVHLDGYRLEGSSLSDLGVDLHCGQKDTVIAIEWPENLKWDLDGCKPTIEIRIDHVSGDERKLTIKSKTDYRIETTFGPPDERDHPIKK